jgi:hypothetical protein
MNLDYWMAQVHSDHLGILRATQVPPFRTLARLGFACWEFHPTLIDGTVFKPGDEMKVLMTADDRRLPVYIETELIVGAAKIHLSEHQNPRRSQPSKCCASRLMPHA